MKPIAALCEALLSNKTLHGSKPIAALCEALLSNKTLHGSKPSATLCEALLSSKTLHGTLQQGSPQNSPAGLSDDTLRQSLTHHETVTSTLAAPTSSPNHRHQEFPGKENHPLH